MNLVGAFIKTKQTDKCIQAIHFFHYPCKLNQWHLNCSNSSLLSEQQEHLLVPSNLLNDICNHHNALRIKINALDTQRKALVNKFRIVFHIFKDVAHLSDALHYTELLSGFKVSQVTEEDDDFRSSRTLNAGALNIRHSGQCGWIKSQSDVRFQKNYLTRLLRILFTSQQLPYCFFRNGRGVMRKRHYNEKHHDCSTAGLRALVTIQLTGLLVCAEPKKTTSCW